MKKLLKNSLISLILNGFVLLISFFVNFIYPKFVPISDYSYSQYYLQYASYIFVFTLGISEGVYLFFGGKNIEELDKRKISSKTLIVICFSIIISLLASSIAYFVVPNYEKKYIFICLGASLLPVIIKEYLLYLFLSTNCIKIGMFSALIDRIVFLILVLIFFVSGKKSYEYFIIADISGKISQCLFLTIFYFKNGFRISKITKCDCAEYYNECKAGFNLTISALANLLLIGIVRLGIENGWDIETYGKISLVISISNLVTSFLKALSLVLFPALRRVKDSQILKNYYIGIRRVCIAFSLIALMFITPLKIILNKWLPDYRDGLYYFAVLFPICVYQIQNTILNTTYFKVIRKERILLYVNLLVLVITGLLTFIFVMAKNLDLLIFSLVFSLTLRYIISSILLSKYLEIKIFLDLIIEVSIVSAFALLHFLTNAVLANIIFAILVILYFGYLFKVKIPGIIEKKGEKNEIV